MRIQTHRDARAKVLSQALESIRLLKSLQWEEFAVEVISKSREHEYRAQIFRSTCLGANGVLAQLAQVLGPVAAFSVLILVAGRPLTASTAFTSLAWFNILRRPLNLLPQACTSLLDCLVSWDRLEALFLWEETTPCLTYHEDPYQAPQRKYSVELRKCSFAWSRDDHPVLRDIDFRAKKGEFIVIVGPVGSGKSSFLSSLIGDCLEVGRGSMAIRGSIAYVGQTPWLMNSTVKQNIVFCQKGEEMQVDDERFWATVKACQMEYDVARFPGWLVDCGLYHSCL